MTRDNLPGDADGDALRRVLASGSDMSKPHVIDFYLCFKDEATARFVATMIPPPASIHKIYMEEGGRWTCLCQATLVPNYDTIVALDRRLKAFCHEHDGNYEGWGTFGVH